MVLGWTCAVEGNTGKSMLTVDGVDRQETKKKISAKSIEVVKEDMQRDATQEDLRDRVRWRTLEIPKGSCLMNTIYVFSIYICITSFTQP